MWNCQNLRSNRKISLEVLQRILTICGYSSTRNTLDTPERWYWVCAISFPLPSPPSSSTRPTGIDACYKQCGLVRVIILVVCRRNGIIDSFISRFPLKVCFTNSLEVRHCYRQWERIDPYVVCLFKNRLVSCCYLNFTIKIRSIYLWQIHN